VAEHDHRDRRPLVAMRGRGESSPELAGHLGPPGPSRPAQQPQSRPARSSRVASTATGPPSESAGVLVSGAWSIRFKCPRDPPCRHHAADRARGESEPIRRVPNARPATSPRARCPPGPSPGRPRATRRAAQARGMRACGGDQFCGVGRPRRLLGWSNAGVDPLHWLHRSHRGKRWPGAAEAECVDAYVGPILSACAAPEPTISDVTGGPRSYPLSPPLVADQADGRMTALAALDVAAGRFAPIADSLRDAVLAYYRRDRRDVARGLRAADSGDEFRTRGQARQLAAADPGAARARPRPARAVLARYRLRIRCPDRVFRGISALR